MQTKASPGNAPSATGRTLGAALPLHGMGAAPRLAQAGSSGTRGLRTGAYEGAPARCGGPGRARAAPRYSPAPQVNARGLSAGRAEGEGYGRSSTKRGIEWPGLNGWRSTRVRAAARVAGHGRPWGASASAPLRAARVHWRGASIRLPSGSAQEPDRRGCKVSVSALHIGQTKRRADHSPPQVV